MQEKIDIQSTAVGIAHPVPKETESSPKKKQEQVKISKKKSKKEKLEKPNVASPVVDKTDTPLKVAPTFEMKTPVPDDPDLVLSH